MKFLVINGPNLNLLGLREPAIYGSRSFAALQDFIRASAADAGVEVDLFQSNHEGAIVDAIQAAYGTADGIVINPAAYTHTSVAILDALKAVALPAVEVHLSDVSAREPFRQISYAGMACVKTYMGLGFEGYRQAILYLKQYLEEADVIIYAGSLVNPQLLEYSKDVCTIHNSAKMTLEEVLEVMEQAEREQKMTVRLHTGDPCLYGAIREQMDHLDELGIAYDSCPGVSSFCGAAAALNLEYTLPEVSQSVVITRMEGRTPVPAKEKIAAFASHNATMVLFLSTGLLEKLEGQLIEGGYKEDTPAAIVYKATWPEEESYICTVSTLAETAKAHGITKTALIVVGEVLGGEYERSLLYHPEFTTEFRQGKGKEGAGNV